MYLEETKNSFRTTKQNYVKNRRRIGFHQIIQNWNFIILWNLLSILYIITMNVYVGINLVFSFILLFCCCKSNVWDIKTWLRCRVVSIAQMDANSHCYREKIWTVHQSKYCSVRGFSLCVLYEYEMEMEKKLEEIVSFPWDNVKKIINNLLAITRFLE